MFEHHSVRHSSGPYKVHVMHTHVVAHQTFAMRLLLWLKKLIEEVDGFRTLFGQIVTEVRTPGSDTPGRPPPLPGVSEGGGSETPGMALKGP